MKLIRMFTGSDGRSHLEEQPIDLEPITTVAGEAVLRPLHGQAVVRMATGTMPDLHPAPRNQYLVVLEGELDVVVAGGDTMPIGPGDVIQVEDTWGEGHILRFRNGCQRYAFFFAPIAETT